MNNASVLSTAVIQPPQALVDAATKFFNDSGIGLMSFDMSACGIVNFEANNILANLGGDGFNILLQDNAMNLESVNGILAALVAAGGTNATLNISGTDMAQPIGHGLDDKAILIARGWTVTTS